jgi:hypothetical protein
MSFHVEFVSASVEEAAHIINEDCPTLPASVKSFLIEALEGCKGAAVSIAAHGYLYAPGAKYDNSTVNIVVKRLAMRTAAPPPKVKVKGPKPPKG